MTITEDDLDNIKRMMEEALAMPSVAHNTNVLIPVKSGYGLQLKEKIILKHFDKKNTFIVTMYYRNKTVQTFLIKGSAKCPYFLDNKKGYILYPPAGWNDLNSKHTHLYYAEGFVMPIDTISVRGDLATLSINPSDVRDIMDGEEIKIVLTAQSLTKWIKLAILLIGIVLFIVFILALVQVIPLMSKVFSKATPGLPASG